MFEKMALLSYKKPYKAINIQANFQKNSFFTVKFVKLKQSENIF